MNAEFNWWLLIVGLVVGAGIVWLVVADWSRREQDLTEDERAAESAWIARALHERGQTDPIDPDEVLALHRAYLQVSGLLASPAGFDDPGEPEPDAGMEPDDGADDAADEPTDDAADDVADEPAVQAGIPPANHAVATDDRLGPDLTAPTPADGPASDDPMAATNSTSTGPAPDGTGPSAGVSGGSPAADRPSVRMSPVSPRGSSGEVRSEPPTT